MSGFFCCPTWSLSIVRLGCPPPTRSSAADMGLERIEELRNAPCPRELSIMSRRAKKQRSERGPVSGTHSSGRKQQRRKARPVLVVVPNAISSSSALITAASAPGAVEVAPAPTPAGLPSPAANLAAEPPLSDEALLDVELSFFEGWSTLASEVSAVAEPSPLITDDVDTEDVDSLRLTPEQHQRRQWFRRQVTVLMAGMGALGTAAIAVRIASLL